MKNSGLVLLLSCIPLLTALFAELFLKRQQLYNA